MKNFTISQEQNTHQQEKDVTWMSQGKGLGKNLPSIHIPGNPMAATRFWSYILQLNTNLRLTGGHR